MRNALSTIYNRRDWHSHVLFIGLPALFVGLLAFLGWGVHPIAVLGGMTIFCGVAGIVIEVLQGTGVIPGTYAVSDMVATTTGGPIFWVFGVVPVWLFA